MTDQRRSNFKKKLGKIIETFESEMQEDFLNITENQLLVLTVSQLERLREKMEEYDSHNKQV
jgi:hypothetical protein